MALLVWNVSCEFIIVSFFQLLNEVHFKGQTTFSHPDDCCYWVWDNDALHPQRSNFKRRNHNRSSETLSFQPSLWLRSFSSRFTLSRNLWKSINSTFGNAEKSFKQFSHFLCSALRYHEPYKNIYHDHYLLLPKKKTRQSREEQIVYCSGLKQCWGNKKTTNCINFHRMASA